MTQEQQEQQQAATSHEVAYDADALSAARLKQTYRVGGVEYTPRKKTGRLVKEILELGGEAKETEYERDPEGALIRDDKGRAIEKPLPLEEQLAGIDRLYKQVALLLVGPNGENPDWEQLAEDLDMEDAREMVGPLMGNKADEADPSKGDSPQN